MPLPEVPQGQTIVALELEAENPVAVLSTIYLSAVVVSQKC